MVTYTELGMKGQISEKVVKKRAGPPQVFIYMDV